MDFKNKTALVTGASRGLGRALAQELGRRGARLVIAARGARALEDARAELARATEVVAVAADVSEDAETIVAAGVERFGAIDLLINNASELGPSPMPPLSELRGQDLERILRVNVLAPLHLAQLVLPGMLRRGGGVIVNVSSDAGVNAYPGWGGYGASKAALEHLTKTLRAELGETPPIRLLCVDPGDMDTEMHRAAEPGVDLSHLPDPKEVAPALVALIEDDAVDGRFEAQRLQTTAVR